MATRRRGWDDRWRTYPASKPRPTDSGITTRKQRGAMADTWWSRRLLDLLDSYGLGARMQRGRRYARQGQLVSFDVQPGLVIAEVQGSRRTPYVGSVVLTPLTEPQWGAVQREMESTLQFAARLARRRGSRRARSRVRSRRRGVAAAPLERPASVVLVP